MSASPLLIAAAFLIGSSGVALVALLLGARRNRVERRLDDIAGRTGAAPDRDPVAEFTRSTLPMLGTVVMPSSEEKRSRLQTRLTRAGWYGPQALAVFLGIKVLLMGVPIVVGLCGGMIEVWPLAKGVTYGTIIGGLLGIVLPGAWLDYRKVQRQIALRRALPDALDVIVICLEGGLSLPGAFRRVVSELRLAHPLLALEMNIVQREVQLGRSTGEALRQFGDRCDLEEVRSLASVVLQSEKFGASLAKALRVHAESLRVKRLQRAEEMAQKAALKVMFPTALFIFPAMFLVIVGPAAIQLLDLFAQMKR